MPRRLYREARPALRNTRFDTRPSGSMLSVSWETEVNRSMTAEQERLSGDVDALRDRYGDTGREAIKLRKQMDSGELTYAQAGARVDELRGQLERLDALPQSLYHREDTIADAMEDPLGFLDRMYERAPSLRRPEYPW